MRRSRSRPIRVLRIQSKQQYLLHWLAQMCVPLSAAGRGDGESVECRNDPSRVLRGSYGAGDFWRGFLPVLEAEQGVAGSPLPHTWGLLGSGQVWGVRDWASTSSWAQPRWGRPRDSKTRIRKTRTPRVVQVLFLCSCMMIGCLTPSRDSHTGSPPQSCFNTNLCKFCFHPSPFLGPTGWWHWIQVTMWVNNPCIYTE